MDMTRHGLNEAIQLASKGQIETWIHNFLNSEGDNVGLSESLRQRSNM